MYVHILVTSTYFFINGWCYLLYFYCKILNLSEPSDLDLEKWQLHRIQILTFECFMIHKELSYYTLLDSAVDIYFTRIKHTMLLVLLTQPYTYIFS